MSLHYWLIKLFKFFISSIDSFMLYLSYIALKSYISSDLFRKKNPSKKKKKFLTKNSTFAYSSSHRSTLGELFPLEWIDSRPITVYTFWKERRKRLHASFATRGRIFFEMAIWIFESCLKALLKRCICLIWRETRELERALSQALNMQEWGWDDDAQHQQRNNNDNVERACPVCKWQGISCILG